MYTGLTRDAFRLHENQSGQVTAWFVGIALLLFGIMAFAIDGGFWFLDRRHAQNQVDAAVLAGVQELPAVDVSAADAAAHDWLNRNNRNHQTTINSECGQDPSENYTLVSVHGFAFGDDDGDGEYDKIRACVRRDGFLLFARILELTDVTIPAVAAARIRYEPLPYALMAMRPGDCENMFFSGSGEMNVNLVGGANTYTESTDASCEEHFRVDGTNATITTDGEHHVRGTAGGCGPPGNLHTCVHDPDDTSEHNIVENYPGDIDDPWGCQPDSVDGSCVPVPAVDETVDCSTPEANPSFTSSGSLSPGTYCSLSISGTGTEVTLEEGVYVFKQGVFLDGGADTRLTSNGAEVLIYMTCEPPPCGADPKLCCDGIEPESFNIRGNDGSAPKLEITGHSDYEDIAIWVDRSASNDESCREVGGGEYASVSLTGQGDVELNGNVYAIGTTVDFGGQGAADYTLNGTIVADRICFRGEATYTVDWSVTAAARPPIMELYE